MNEAVYEFFATCLPGAEKLLADELHGLGVRKVRPLSGGASFFGAPEDALRACLWSRLAGRVNLTVGRVAARDADALYAGVRELPWDVVGKAAQGRFQSTENDRTIRVNFFNLLAVYNDRPIGSFTCFIAGGISILAAFSLGSGVMSHHGINVAGGHHKA